MWCDLADVLAEMGDQNLYEVLGVPQDADLVAIKKAYRQLALACHPDRHPDDPTCEERFKQVSAAYEVLSNPRLRAGYDASRGASRSVFTPRERHRGWDKPAQRVHRVDPSWWEEGAFDFSAAPNVGPFMAVSFDQITVKKARGGAERRFRIIVYGAYNAFGLIGSEENGVAILDEDRRHILVDKISPQSSGYYGPSPAQRAIAEDLMRMPATAFRVFVNNSPRRRYSLDTKLNPEGL